MMEILVFPTNYTDNLPELREWAKEQIEKARSQFEEEGVVLPVFMFLAPAPQDPKVIMQCLVPLDEFFSGSSREEVHARKESAVEFLKQLLMTSKAFASLLITEIWITSSVGPAVSLEETLKAVQQAGGVEKTAGRQEGLMTIFETKTSHDGRVWRINRDEQEKPHVEDVLLEMPQIGGRFAGLLFASRPPGVVN